MTTLAAWIFFVAVIELMPMGKTPNIPDGDKLVHIALYTITALLIFTFLIRKLRFKTALLLTVLLPTLYGAGLEILQGLTGRTPSFWDAVANAFGASMAAVFIGYKRGWK